MYHNLWTLPICAFPGLIGEELAGSKIQKESYKTNVNKLLNASSA